MAASWRTSATRLLLRSRLLACQTARLRTWQGAQSVPWAASWPTFVANPRRMSDSRAAELSAQADRAVGGVLANLRGTPAPAPARGIARAALADMSGKAVTGVERAAAMAPAPVPVAAPAYTPGQYSSPYMRANYAPVASMAYPAPGYEEDFMAAYPSAVMSYPNRTVGYQYAAGAPVTPYMSPVSSRPVPQGAIMSMVRRSR